MPVANGVNTETHVVRRVVESSVPRAPVGSHEPTGAPGWVVVGPATCCHSREYRTATDRSASRSGEHLLPVPGFRFNFCGPMAVVSGFPDKDSSAANGVFTLSRSGSARIPAGCGAVAERPIAIAVGEVPPTATDGDGADLLPSVRGFKSTEVVPEPNLVNRATTHDG